MQEIILIIQTVIAIALVATILLQRSEGGALGIGGGPGGLMSARGAGNLLTRATTVLAILFIGLSMGLTILARQQSAPTSILDAPSSEAPITAPADEAERYAPGVPADLEEDDTSDDAQVPE